MLKITDGRDAFFQWDTAQTLTVENEPGKTVAEVHIGHEHGNVYSFEPVDGVVTVPDELLQCSEKIVAFEWIKVTDGGYTTRKYTFHVAKRPKVDNYTYTPTRAQSWEYWSDLAKTYAERAELALSEVPGAMRDYWREHKDDFKGDPGPRGETGPQGVQGIPGVAGLRGPQGEPGRDGRDGKDGRDGIDAQPYDDTEIRSEINRVNESITELDERVEVLERGGGSGYDDREIRGEIAELSESVGEIQDVVLDEKLKDITDEFVVNHDGMKLAIGLVGRNYTDILTPVAEAVVNVYKCKKGQTFKIKGVWSNTFFVAWYLTHDFKTTSETILPEQYGYDVAETEITVDNDYPYVAIESRYKNDLRVELFVHESKVPTKLSQLDNDEGFVSSDDIPETYQTVYSKNLFTNKNNTIGFMNGKDSIVTSSDYFVSDYIPVKKGSIVIQHLYIDATVRITCTTYDDNMNPLTYSNNSGVKYVQKNIEQDGYVRFCTYNGHQKGCMVFVGEQPLNEYIPYFEPYESASTRLANAITDRVDELIAKNDALNGKKWCVLGDSFSYGATTGKLESGKYKGENKVYPYFIGNRHNMDIISFFAGGRTLAYPEVPNGFTNSVTCPTVGWYYQNIPEDVDYITIYLGINDSHHRSASSGGDGEDNTGVIPLGTINDITVHTYYGAWNVVLSWLMEHRPFAHIGILVSNGCDTADYRTAQLEIAKKYGVPYIDLNGDARTPVMIRSQNPDIAQSVKNIVDRKQAVDYDGSKTGSANQHPNDEAHEYESWFIENFLRSL